MRKKDMKYLLCLLVSLLSLDCSQQVAPVTVSAAKGCQKDLVGENKQTCGPSSSANSKEPALTQAGCQAARTTALAEGTETGDGFIPECNDDLWQVVQKNPATGSSYCVDPQTGTKIENTETLSEIPNCDSSSPKVQIACQAALANAIARSSTGMDGVFIPKCNGNLWRLIQNNGSTGYSYCVNPKTGVMIEGTSIRGTPNCVQTSTGSDTGTGSGTGTVSGTGTSTVSGTGTGTGTSTVSNTSTGLIDCQAALAEVMARNSVGMTGVFIPKCNGNLWELIQNNGSTGYSFCVNPKTGATVEGTSVRGTPNCQ